MVVSRTARKSVATKELLRHVAKRSTGRLSVSSPVGAITVYLMAGDIIGAETSADDAGFLRRVRLAGALPTARLRALDALSAAGEPLFGFLLDEVAPELIEPILFDRYRDNIVGFVAQDDLPRFEALPGVFVDNMQMGQNAARLIDSACKDADLAQRVEGSLEVVLGSEVARDEVEQALLDHVGDEPIRVDDVLARAPVEPWTGLALVASLLDSGALHHAVTGGPPPATLDGNARLKALAALAEAPTLYDDDSIPPPDPAEPKAAELKAATPEPEEIEPDALEPEPLEPEELDDVEPEDLEPDDVEPEDLEDLEPEEVEPEPLEPDDAEVSEPVAPSPAGVGFDEDDVDTGSTPRPEDMAMWLDQGDHLDEEDLAFFEDHEDDRGAGAGGFSTDAHNLDKVDVGGERGAPAPDADVLEADEAPTAKFSAPMLSEGDAYEKIEVCNDVLRRVAAAFDEAEGPGAGRAAVQLLVDGSPSKFTALLHDLSVGEDGVLPPDEVLGNLWSRPPTEHRQLINSALKNVIERALSSAADALPEEAFDEVYESVAGYNQRLGL